MTASNPGGPIGLRLMGGRRGPAAALSIEASS